MTWWKRLHNWLSRKMSTRHNDAYCRYCGGENMLTERIYEYDPATGRAHKKKVTLACGETPFHVTAEWIEYIE